MDSETKDIIEKHLKICPDCGKTFLGIIKRGYYTYEHLKYCSSNIEKYPLQCGKCPDCAWKCYENVDKIIEYVKQNNSMPCNNKLTIFEYFDKKDKETTYDEKKIKEYIKVHFQETEISDIDSCYPIFKTIDYLDSVSDLELIDLLDFFKEK